MSADVQTPFRCCSAGEPLLPIFFPSDNQPVGGLLSGDRLPTIETERLRIRWLTSADVPALFEIFSHPEVMRFWSRPPLRDTGEARDLLREIHGCFAAGTLYQWGIGQKSDEHLIGTCTLAAISPEHKRAEIGFALGREHWGHGYATEAIRALLTYAFDTLGLHRIEGDVDPGNHRSLRCLEQFGFKREGYARERYRIDGQVFDSVLYGLLKREFASVEPRPGDPPVRPRAN